MWFPGCLHRGLAAWLEPTVRIIFSKDRAAQLDLLLQSLEKNAEPEETRVFWLASSLRFWDGYRALYLLEQQLHPGDFNAELRETLDDTQDETVTFFCDDDVLFRSALGARSLLLSSPGMLSFSLRLGRGNVHQDWPFQPHETRLPPMWYWELLPRHDFGFPGSIDGHVFRTADVVRMIGGDVIETPTALEAILAHRCDMLKDERPLMGCFPDQRLVGVPVNRVSEQSGCGFGERFPQSAEEMNERWLAGERIDLEALDFSGVDGCHVEVPFVWKKR